MQERIFNSMKKSNMKHQLRAFFLTVLTCAALTYLSGCGNDDPPTVNRAPAFGEDNYAFEVAEKAATGDAVGTVSATDEDSDELAYVIKGSQTTFDIGASTGAVIVAESAALDFETTTSYSIRVQVSDGTDTATADVTITINDVNEFKPEFAENPYRFSLAANAAGGVEVGTVSATDLDGTAILMYSLSGEGTANFSIGNTAAASGEGVSVAVAANAELPSLASPVTIIVTADDGDNTVDAEVEITVIPTETNAPPVFANTPYNFNVASDATGEAVVGPVSATDIDAGDLLTYTLSGTDAGHFEINNTPVASGTAVPITVAANADLASLGGAVTLMATVTDDATPALTATANVEIMIVAVGVNVSPVFDQTAYTFEISEGATSGDEVGKLSATDSNTGDLLTYTLSGIGAANFSITNGTEVASGVEVSVTVSSTASLDFETTPSYTLEVQVSDDAATALTATAAVTVNVTNVPTAPVLTVSGTQTLTLNEGTTASIMATGYTVSATDEDNDEVTFSVDDDRFGIADDGALNVLAAKVFDHETEPTLMLTITATDDSPSTLTDTETVNIAVTDVAEPPVLTISGTQTLALNEGTTAGIMATGYTVSATDEDNDEVTFSVDDDHFAIADDGALNVLAAKVFDHETEPTLMLTITATDDSPGTLTDTETVNIAVTDVAGAPVLTISGTQTLTLNEGTTASLMATGFMVTATDEDNDGVTFSVDDDRFDIADDGTLNVLAAKVFDHETEPTLMLTITATDDNTGALTDTEMVNIAITDVATAPVITISGTQTLTLNEGTTASLMATGFMVTATDEDNDGVTFSVNDDRFGLADDGTLNVLADKEFDYEDAANPSGEITLTVTATDDNTGALTNTADVTITVTNVTFSTLLTTEDASDYSAPAFGDVDGDGDLDLLVGEDHGILHFYRWGEADGTGSGWSDQTAALTGTLAPLATTSNIHSIPAFGDVDGDGDLDLLVGTGVSILNFFRLGTNSNSAETPGTGWTAVTGSANPFNVRPSVGAFTDDGAFSAPAFGDVDGDGDLDVLVGESSGMLDFYRWGDGSGSGTGWSERTEANNPFSGSDFDIGLFSSPAFGDVDGDGDKDLVVGANDGKLHFFRLGTNSNSATSPGTGWTVVTGTDNPFNAPNDDDEFDVGSRASPAFGDVDGDGDTDLVVGEFDGTLNIWYRLSDGTWSQTSDAI